MAVFPRLAVPRRRVLQHLFVSAGSAIAVVGLPRLRPAMAQTPLMTVSGAGVNIKQMPGVDGGGMVALRESFSFDANYAQCIIEDNASAIAMPTFAMGEVVIARISSSWACTPRTSVW